MSSSVSFNQSGNIISTLALFNISLSLELAFPTNNTSAYISSPVKESILDKHLDWNGVKDLGYSNISESWLNAIDGWYIPLMSRGAGEQMYKFFLGENKSIDGTTDKEWRKMCATEDWIEPISLMRGFGETQVVKCYSDQGVLGAWNATYWSDKGYRAEKASVAMTYADNKSYVVEVRVWEDQSKDWMVFATKTKISKNDRGFIMEHVTSLGFDPMDVISVSYDNCRPLP